MNYKSGQPQGFVLFTSAAHARQAVEAIAGLPFDFIPSGPIKSGSGSGPASSAASEDERAVLGAYTPGGRTHSTCCECCVCWRMSCRVPCSEQGGACSITCADLWPWCLHWCLNVLFPVLSVVTMEVVFATPSSSLPCQCCLGFLSFHDTQEAGLGILSPTSSSDCV